MFVHFHSGGHCCCHQVDTGSGQNGFQALAYHNHSATVVGFGAGFAGAVGFADAVGLCYHGVNGHQ